MLDQSEDFVLEDFLPTEDADGVLEFFSLLLALVVRHPEEVSPIEKKSKEDKICTALCSLNVSAGNFWAILILHYVIQNVWTISKNLAMTRFMFLQMVL